LKCRRYEWLAGLTQQELAKRAGIREETLSRIESGKHPPTLKTLKKSTARWATALVPIDAGSPSVPEADFIPSNTPDPLEFPAGVSRISRRFPTASAMRLSIDSGCSL
jgi:transcriptional regulator with XRE-family HTH domain